MLSTSSNDLKSSSYGHSAQTLLDMVIYRVSDSGSVIKGKQISLSIDTSSNTIDSVLQNNLLKRSGDYYMWAGHSYGYSTGM